MGTFIGYGDVGVLANNSERNAFLDWFVENRCSPEDSLWEYCKSEGNRWNDCCIELQVLIPVREPLGLIEEESSKAARDFWPHVAQLLVIIDSITRGEWLFRVDERASIDWRRD